WRRRPLPRRTRRPCAVAPRRSAAVAPPEQSASAPPLTKIARPFLSQPSAYATHIVGIGGIELTGHFRFFIGNVDEIRSREYGDGRDEHWPGAGPERNSQRDKDKAEIHWVPGESIGTVGNQLAVGR